jgi:PTH1 family peptidyl-tRNA hydrolase
VLSDFSKSDDPWLAPLLDAVATELPKLLAGDEAGFLNRLGQALPSKKPDPIGDP